MMYSAANWELCDEKVDILEGEGLRLWVKPEIGRWSVNASLMKWRPKKYWEHAGADGI